MRQLSRALFPRIRRRLELDLSFPPPEREISIASDRYTERVIPIAVVCDGRDAKPVRVQLADVFGARRLLP